MILTNDEPPMIQTNDGSSCSSHITEESVNPKITPECMKPRSTTAKRRVRFELSSNRTFTTSETSDEGSESTWYTKKDFQSFQDNAKRIIHRMSCIESDGRCSEETFYEMIKSVHGAVDEVDYVLEDASDIMDCMEEKLAALYTRIGGIHMIGLERRSVMLLRNESHSRRYAIQHAVYEIQLEYKSGLWSEDEVRQELRDCCCAYSQASALFAQLIAQAQLMA